MRQENINVAAPGFLGVNTELAPIQLEPGWAAIADNAIVDSNGRIASRKGYVVLTSDNSDLGVASIAEMHQANYSDGTTLYFAVGNNKIFTFNIDTGALTDITPGAATITADLWQIATVNDDTFFFQAGHAPIVYDKSASTCSLVTAHANYAATVPVADCCVGAFGRMWAAGVSGSAGTLHWSDLLIPAAWGGGSSGSLDLTNLWPTGNDQITAIAAHNAKLIVFGRNNILVFGSSASDGRLGNPNTDIFLEDTIANVGCVSKYGTTVVGSDLWFIDDTGVRSLGRTIQEKSLPIGDISGNVRKQLQAELRSEANKPRLVYDSDNAFCLLILEGLPHTYCFDTRGLLENGAARTTMWTGLDFACVMRTVEGGVFFGNNDGVCEYTGAQDNGESFQFRYYMHPQAFGVPANLKIPKEVDWTIGGGVQQRAVCFWGFNYQYRFESQPFILNADTPDFYNLDEYNITTADQPLDPTEYNSGGVIGRYNTPLSGSGENLIVGLEIKVDGEAVSIQEINIQTKIGRMT